MICIARLHKIHSNGGVGMCSCNDFTVSDNFFFDDFGKQHENRVLEQKNNICFYNSPKKKEKIERIGPMFGDVKIESKHEYLCDR
jgi:hypothetical protein